MRSMAFALALLGAAVAAPPQETGGPRGAGARRGGREEIFKMVDAYIVSNLQESLGLGDDQFVKLLPLVKRLQNDRRDMAQRRFAALAEMHRLFESGTATEPRIAELMRELRAVESEEPGAIRKDMDGIDGVLSPLQQAKFRILEAKVERKIRELMARVRMQGQGARPGREGTRDEPPF